MMLDREKEDRLELSRQWSASNGQLMPGLLLGWFGRMARVLPWRQDHDPYRIWLSEIMLQQTQVQTVIPYYQRFLDYWPTLADLAGASEEQVLKLWEGLGYYSRARNLLAAAGQIRDCHQGLLPSSEKELRRLPGIGEYTAGAILSIAFGQPVAAVDGNVVRVFSRLTAIPWQPADPVQRREVRQLTESLLPKEHPGDFNEALMDLGATICLPRQPRCQECPLNAICQACRLEIQEQLPPKALRKAIPVDQLTLLVLVWQGQVHVRQRPAKGLLAGLFEFDWLAGGSASEKYPQAKISALGTSVHQFTHRQWQIEGFWVELAENPECDESGRWVNAQELAALPFPTALAGFRELVLARMGCF